VSRRETKSIKVVKGKIEKNRVVERKEKQIERKREEGKELEGEEREREREGGRERDRDRDRDRFGKKEKNRVARKVE